jgi:LysR family glycine cleavage system transcriptional activator
MSSDYSKRRMPSLNALRAFEAAARHLSLKTAAEELHVSQSAISHQVKALEQHLGVVLFERKTRGVELTRKGRLYYPILREAFDSIAEGTRNILGDTSVPVTNLQVYATFATRWLLPRLARLQEQRSDFQVHVHTAQRDVNFEHSDVDAAILIGQPGESRLHYDHLFDCYLSPVCSPAYLERHGAICVPGDLSTRMLLQVYPSARDWQVWLDANQADGVNPEEGLQLESYDVALSSAAQGMGVALGQQPYISEALHSGELVELFPERRVTNPNRWYLAYRSDRRQQQKVEPFREWLLGEVSADDTLPAAASS